MLGLNDTQNMMRFLIAASRMLGEEADREIERMNDRDDAGKQERANAVAP